jgi:predicted transcriptional regulator
MVLGLAQEFELSIGLVDTLISCRPCKKGHQTSNHEQGIFVHDTIVTKSAIMTITLSSSM